MTKPLWIIAIGALALSACSGSSGVPGTQNQLPTVAELARNGVLGPGAPLPEPPEVDPVHKVATVVLSTIVDPATALPAFLYQGQKGVAPTIRVNPGDTIVVDVQNALPPSGGMASDMNLHFHGLEVSPEAPSDDVITMLAMPGGSLHYVVKLPKNAEPGLYWYHPHVHGQTDYQVGSGGMSGAIVVNGLEKHYPALAAMKERLMIVRDVAASAPDALSLRHHDGAPMQMPMGDAGDARLVRRPLDEDSNTNPCGPDPGLTVTVNGVVSPRIKIAAGESQFFRVVNATGHKNMDLAVDGASLELVAIDGVALDAFPGTAATQIVPDFVLPPAARAEFVVTGTGTPAAFHTKCFNSGPTGDPDPDTLLATLTPGMASSHHAVAALPHLRVGAPLPVNPLSSSFPPVAAERTVVLNEDSNAMYINGSPYSPAAPPLF
ncbi:MAG TPA: multicopper oxidase domain-containing protein, partial [Candidatus Acidoferrales bacterium]|nr:multicopper oxidase domain-containing protein [Candidatus Acidoferrales bacterium]